MATKTPPPSERQLRIQALKRYGLKVPKKTDPDAPAVPVPDQATATAIAAFCRQACENALLQGIVIKGFKQMRNGRKWALIVLRSSPKDVGKRGAFMHDPVEEKRLMALECRPFMERIRGQPWAARAVLLRDLLHHKRGQYTQSEWDAAPFRATWSCDPDATGTGDGDENGQADDNGAQEKKGKVTGGDAEDVADNDPIALEMMQLHRDRLAAAERQRALDEIKDIAAFARDVFVATDVRSRWVVQIHDAKMAEVVRTAFLACLRHPAMYRGGGMVWHGFKLMPDATCWAVFEAAPARPGTPARYLSFASDDAIASFGGMNSRGFWHMVYDVRRAGSLVMPLTAIIREGEGENKEGVRPDLFVYNYSPHEWDAVRYRPTWTPEMFAAVPKVCIAEEILTALFGESESAS